MNSKVASTHLSLTRASLRVLVWMLVTSATWPTTCAFDLLTGFNFGYNNANAPKPQDTRHFYSKNWEPSSFWWRSRRSVQSPPPSPYRSSKTGMELKYPVSLPDLSYSDFKSPPSKPVWFQDQKQSKSPKYPKILDNEIDPDDNEVLPTFGHDRLPLINVKPLFRSKVLEPPSKAKYNKLLTKIRKIEEIKNALRARNKNAAVEKEQERLAAMDPSELIHEAEMKLKKLEKLDHKAFIRQQKTIKSRRAKMLAARHQPLPIVDAHGLSLSASKFSSEGLGRPQMALVGDDTEPQGFGDVEWFGKPPSSGFHQPESHGFQASGFLPNTGSGGFGSSHKASGFGDEAIDSKILLENSFAPFKDFTPMKEEFQMEEPEFFEKASSAGSRSRASSKDDQMLGFWGEGSFQDDNKDCDTITTKSCFSDSDCSCHGFYHCSQGQCHSKGNTKQATVEGQWHDEPIDFGFLKRSSDDPSAQADDASSHKQQKRAIQGGKSARNEKH